MRSLSANTGARVMLMSEGTLYMIATPIGNLDDVSFRSLKVMESVQVFACEDTRHTMNLMTRHQIKKPEILIAYHEHNEQKMAATLINFLKQGKSVAVMTDAGSPGVSDPGYRIVSAAQDQGIHVEVIPGPSAVIAALTVSGLPSSSFTFKGFAPKKTGQRKHFLEAEINSPHTLIFFESPFRIGGFLSDACEVLGDRLAAVCIELTKKFERVHRDYLSALAPQFAGKKEKGEITVVIASNNPKFLRKTTNLH